MKFTAEQFDPNKPYHEWFWCKGEFQFFCATPRGHVRVHNQDWGIEFENGERVVVSNATYKEFFEGLLITQEVAIFNEDMAERPVRPPDTEPMERQNPKSRKQRNSSKREGIAGEDAPFFGIKGE